MTPKPPLSSASKWTIVVGLAASHPLLLRLLHPLVGDVANSLVLAAPVVATLLFGWRIGSLFVVLNTISSAIVFNAITDMGATEGIPRGALAMGVTATVCFGADRLRHFLIQRKVLAAELYQARKMEAIGRLAGGVAHDMNNTLNAIMGSAFALRQELLPYGRRFADLDNIAAACDRGSQLTRNLLGFARKSSYRNQLFSLNAVLEDTEALLTRTASKRIHITTHSANSLPLVEGDRGQVENAIMNLCLNALDAMPGEGTLTLGTALDDGFVSISVRDTGMGMDAEIQEHAFEPFFTTKPAGEGTGLGLSMVYGVVHAMNGKLVLESTPGEGTVVTLRLPPATGTRNDACAQSSSPESMKEFSFLQGQTVLLIDDEPLVLRAAIRVLSTLGCTVLSAGSGREGIELLKRHRDSISLAIIDLIMPEMDGAITLERLLDINQRLPALLVSGYTRESDRVEAIQRRHATVGFLPKPYHPNQLVTAAKRLMASVPESELRLEHDAN